MTTLVRVESGPQGVHVPASEAQALDSLDLAIVSFLLRRQAAVFSGGLSRHAHVPLADCAFECRQDAEVVSRRIEDIKIVYRDEALPARRLLSTGVRIGPSIFSDERVKVEVLGALWSDPGMSDGELSNRLGRRLELSPSGLRTLRDWLGLPATAVSLLPPSERNGALQAALRRLAPCVWLREHLPFGDREARGGAVDSVTTPSRSSVTSALCVVGPALPLPNGLTHIVRPLFAHQREGVAKLEEWFAEPAPSRGILCLPTGAGKTKTAVTFVLQTVLAAQKRCLWLANGEELLNQAFDAFAEGSALARRPFSLGRWQAGSKKARQPADVIVASIPTLTHEDSRGLSAFGACQGVFDICVIDECHHGAAPTWRRLLDSLFGSTGRESPSLARTRVLGLSATPTRANDKEVPLLRRYFGDIIFESPLMPLINDGVLAKPVLRPESTGRSFSATAAERAQFEQFGGEDLPSALVNRIAADPVRNEFIVDRYMANRSEWGQTLVFAATVDQSERLLQHFKSHGVKAAAVYGTSSDRERRSTVEQFRDGRLEVVVNCSVFAEGTDLPSTKTVILAKPTKSRVRFAQMVGRAMRGRRTGGTDDCIIVSFFDEVRDLLQNHLASGFTLESELMVALGEQPSAVTDEVAEDEQSAAIHADGNEAAARSLFLANDLGPVEGDMPLLGWFEAANATAQRLLPCFSAEDRLLIELWASTRGHPVPAVASVPIEAHARFFDFCRSADVRVRWCPIVRPMTDEALTQLVESLGQVAQPPVPVPVALPDDEPTLSVRSETMQMEPEWWGYAKTRANQPSDSVQLEAGIVVSSAALQRAREFWERFRNEIDPETSDHFVQIARMKNKELAPAALENLELLLRQVFASGTFPAVAGKPAPADAASLLGFLGDRPRSEWKDVIRKVSGADIFVLAGASPIEILVELNALRLHGGAQ